MIEVVGVTFKEKGQVYYFSPGKIRTNKKVTVVVETDRGLHFGKVETDRFEIPENKIKGTLKPIIRIATKDDYQRHLRNLSDAKEALKKARELANSYNLNMQLIDAAYTFDRDQLLFRFLADARVDFRDLAKDLARLYRTRIELRQLGARDKAKEIGGCGMCGQKICCSKFLEDMDSVSISMAKNQNLSLNPNKINGVCGRLLCCLKYEDDCYRDCRKCLPDVGTRVKTEHGEGRVVDLDILNGKYYVDVKDIGRVGVEVEK